MQSLILAASVAGLSAYALPSNATVTASPNIVYTTEVVTALTTYCPASTTLTFNSKTYTVTSATTLTITDCPCTVHKPVPTGHAQDECAKKCSNALFECKAKPDANQSSCVSEYNSCLGFQAIGGGKADYYPSACSKGDNPPAPTGTGHNQDECAKKCSDALFECKAKPDANQSSCVSEYNSCLGFQAIGGGKADYYPSACSKEGTNPPAPTVPATPRMTDANQSTCVSNYNSCLGFQAIGGGKADYYPAACSKEGNTPAPTGTPGQGQGQTPPSGQGQTPPSGQGQTPPSDQGQTPPSDQGQTPPSGQGQTPPAGQGQGQDECAKKCVAALGDCKAQPGANQSFCVSSYNNCLGYEAIGGGKADYSPSACAPKATGTGATAVPTVPVTVGAAGIVRPVSLFVLGAVLLL
ncbi:putative cell wall glycoprotein [Beauveria bassiana ARSEF 2860]|uniref:Putative cell wall glycoprotein n=1 Tax=Beauveria bassiana (strain ARSEF 2860) TaxID=655819 RepID=J4UQI6_BEAB2|nr:putative cell wall glycoprotein [Beauveria bassiana ARSEF 2860]EJP67632.1 putative cell wall glycoprotein [Beauveria bassiana ARSEF 2860]